MPCVPSPVSRRRSSIRTPRRSTRRRLSSGISRPVCAWAGNIWGCSKGVSRPCLTSMCICIVRGTGWQRASTTSPPAMRKTRPMATNLSPASQLALLPRAERDAFLARCTAEELAALEYDWQGFWARPNQLPPPAPWKVWLILAGRGFGKTRAGAEQVIAWARAPKQRLALIGETAADTRDVMVEGESGILACSPPWCMPTYHPTKRRLTWPNGTIATTYSGDAPEQLRGPQHHFAWGDEIAKWRYAQEAWDNLELGLRLGQHPQVVATTTPRPIPLLRALLRDPGTQ